MKTDKNIKDFSVIVVCYNPDFEQLKKTIVSCYKQKEVDYEIIVSDDGSKKEYRKNLEQWADENGIKLVYNFLPENQGTVKNIISAVNIANGKYIKTISPGDYFAEEMVLSEYFQKFEEENADMVFSDGYFYNEEKIYKINMPFFKSTATRNMKKNICLLNDNFLGPSLSFKKEMIHYLYEIQDFVRLMEDLPLTYLTIINNKKICFINKKLFWYEYGTGVSSNPRNLDKDMDGFINYLKQNYPNEKIIKKTEKRRNITKIKNKYYKAIKLFFTIPSSFFKTVSLRLKKIKSYKIDKESLNKITELKVMENENRNN